LAVAEKLFLAVAERFEEQVFAVFGAVFASGEIALLDGDEVFGSLAFE